MRYMIEHGLDVCSAGASDLLHAVAEQGPTVSSAAAAEVLVNAGLFVSAQRKSDYFTPLHCAVISGALPLVETLLRLGADVNAVAQVRVVTTIAFSTLKCFYIRMLIV
jgi:ankyrin repeat protein